MSSPVEGREEEYNDWYQNTHLPEVVDLPGIRSAQRFRQARNLKEGEAYPYLTLYDIETDDIDAVLASLAEAAGSGGINMSDAIDTENAYAVVYQECGPAVGAGK